MIGVGLAVGSMALSAFGAYTSGKQAEAVQRYNAAVAENNSISAQRYNEANMRRMVDADRRTKASSRIQYATSGAVMDSGTPAIVLKEQAENIELDQINALRTARHQESSIRANQPNIKTANTLNTIGTLLGGASNVASSYNTYKANK